MEEVFGIMCWPLVFSSKNFMKRVEKAPQ